MELSVLRETLTTHMHDLKDQKVDETWQKASPELLNAWAQHIDMPVLVHDLLVSADFNRAAADDVVAVAEPSCIARLRYHVQYGDTQVSLITPFEALRKNKFRLTDAPEHIFVPTSNIEGTVAYKELDANTILVAAQSFYKV